MNILSGIDIVQVSRIENNVFRFGERFLNRIFSTQECSYCSAKKNRFSSYAARFAAKEAFIKAVGGMAGQFDLRQIEVLNESSGAPYLNISSPILKSLGLDSGQISLSMSHEKEYAVASVIIVKNTSHDSA